MTTNQTKYADYFQIDESYFPQINDESIKKGEELDPNFWMKTYPHKTFVEILKRTKRILDGGAGKSLWIYGAYGTGKSQCAYALRKILDPKVTNNDLETYFNRYEPLRLQKDLLEQLKAKKNEGNVLTVYRYASSDIDSNRILFYRIQESVLKALQSRPCAYLGTGSLRGAVLDWLEDPSNQKIFAVLLQKYPGKFPVTTAAEIIKKLKDDNKDHSELISTILDIGHRDGIRAFTLTVDNLIEWLRDVMERNQLKIFFIWDEFSEYFKNNRNSLTEFQKLVEMYDAGFFFVPVVHEFESLFTDKNNQEWKKLRDRFYAEKIELPNDIAFALIGEAMTKKPSAETEWNLITEDLSDRVADARKVVCKAAKLQNEDVVKNVLPIHPVTVLALKYIAEFFQSNQRSIFNFIKVSKEDHGRAFQSYIEEEGPLSQQPFLTIDQLWDFLEKGKDNLRPKVQNMLDAYRRKTERQDLEPFEQVLFKTAVIMQAIDMVLNIDLFRVTVENLHLAFRGIDNWENPQKIQKTADGLVEKNLLFNDPNTKAYIVESGGVGTGERLEKAKGEIEKRLETDKLVQDGEFDTIFELTPPLKLRFAEDMQSGKIKAVGKKNLVSALSRLRTEHREQSGRFGICAVFEHDADESAELGRKVRELADQYKDVQGLVLIDATDVPLSDQQRTDYVNYAAYAQVNQTDDLRTANINSENASRILKNDWKRAVQAGKFIVYWCGLERDACHNVNDVRSCLQKIVNETYPAAYEFTPRLTETQLRDTQAANSANCGIVQDTTGVVVRIEKSLFPQPGVWQTEKYWKTSTEKIAEIKKAVDKLIAAAFRKEGSISLPAICYFLKEKYGFIRSNLYMFLTGFLLKEYNDQKYRFLGKTGPEQISAKLLSQGIALSYSDNKKDLDKAGAILERTPEENAFYNLTKEVWGKDCDTPAAASTGIIDVLKKRGFPLRCLESRISPETYTAVEKFIGIIGTDGSRQLDLLREVGKMAIANPDLAVSLKEAVSQEKLQKSTEEFLRDFENGQLWQIVHALEAEDIVLSETRKLFDVKYQLLWEASTQDQVFSELKESFAFALQTKVLFKENCKTEEDACKVWREILESWFRVSHQLVEEKYPELQPFVGFLLGICRGDVIDPEKLRMTNETLKKYPDLVTEVFVDRNNFFFEAYKLHLNDIDRSDVEQVTAKLPKGMFFKTPNETYSLVSSAADEVRQNQLRNRLKAVWKEKTGTSDPRDWSVIHKMPIRCLVARNEDSEALAAFNAILLPGKTDLEMQEALSFLGKTDLFRLAADSQYREKKFIDGFLADGYGAVITVELAKEAMEKTGVHPYDWYEDPNVKAALKELATKEYQAHGFEKVNAIIDQMNDAEAKRYLKKLITDNVRVGLEILSREESK